MNLRRLFSKSKSLWFTAPEKGEDIEARTQWMGRSWGSKTVWTHGGRPMIDCADAGCKSCQWQYDAGLVPRED